YSYLKASTGSNFAAFDAGIKPDNKPVTIQAVNPKNIQAHGIKKDAPIAIANRFPISIPIKIPQKPPKRQIIMASYKNCFLMTSGVAPIAFLTPISRVLSVTDTNMMF